MFNHYLPQFFNFIETLNYLYLLRSTSPYLALQLRSNAYLPPLTMFNYYFDFVQMLTYHSLLCSTTTYLTLQLRSNTYLLLLTSFNHYLPVPTNSFKSLLTTTYLVQMRLTATYLASPICLPGFKCCLLLAEPAFLHALPSVSEPALKSFQRTTAIVRLH